jgi:hypothetical protein
MKQSVKLFLPAYRNITVHIVLICGEILRIHDYCTILISSHNKIKVTTPEFVRYPHPTAVSITPLVCIHSPITTTPHSCHTHPSVWVQQQNNKPHPSAVPLTPRVRIHSPITNLTPKLSQSLSQPVFTSQQQTSPHNVPTHSVSLYAQPNYKIHPTAVPHTPSVCSHNPVPYITLSCLTHSVSLY